jgi:hypothetical protein
MTPTCESCQEPLGSQARFCPKCGHRSSAPLGGPTLQPTARPSQRPTALAMILTAALLVTVAGGGAWLLFDRAPTPPSPGVDALTPAAPPQPESPLPTLTSSVAVDPTEALAAQAEADQSRAEATIGSWLPQISSKQAGLVVDGVTYDDKRIWAEYTSAAATYPNVILVRSSEFSSFRRPGFWVVLVAEPHATAAAANAWCDTQGFAADDCFAKRLSHTEGPERNSQPRR